MPIADISSRLETFEQRVKPKSEMDQVRTAFDRLQSLFDARYSQHQVWEDLKDAGLQMGFNGFKTALGRIKREREGVKKDLRKMQEASETSACPHCGGALTNNDNVGSEKAGVATAATAQPADAPEGGPSSKSASDGSMGALFARRLRDGSLNRGLLPKQLTVPGGLVRVPGAADEGD